MRVSRSRCNIGRHSALSAVGGRQAAGPRGEVADTGGGGGVVFTGGCRRRGAAGGDRSAGGARGGRGGARARRPPVRLGAASARSSPVPALRRAGVSPRAPGGGGEPRAARPRTAPRRARTPPARPALRPLFLWASQVDGALQRVRCEDYDPRNRIHLTRTQSGWRAFPKTDTFDAIRRGVASPSQPSQPSSAPRERRRRRAGRPRRRAGPKPSPARLEPDLETRIPSHRIAVPRVPPRQLLSPPAPASPEPPETPETPDLASVPPTTAPSPRPPSGAPPPPQPPEPTPLDSLLAVAELEFHQQRGSELEMEGARFAFLPPEEPPSALFDLGEGKSAEVEEAFHSLGAHDDLFESISEANYLPELGGHDEGLLESLVEKGCEDNQIVGRMDRLSAQLDPGAGFEEEALLSETPVDIIGRLQSLGSPSRSAAQGLLHLRHLELRRPSAVDPFVPEDVFAPEPQQPQPAAAPALRLGAEAEPADLAYSERVPQLPDAFDYEDYENIAQRPEETPVRTDATSSEEAPRDALATTEVPELKPDENDFTDIKLDLLVPIDDNNEDFKLSMETLERLKNEGLPEEIEKATDLSSVLEIDTEERPAPASQLPTAIDSLPFSESASSDKNDDLPKDLSIHRRLSSSYSSPRRIEIPRAPSRESDAMQSPQPSGIPAISSPEVFNTPTTKSKQPSFLESLYGSTSPKMYNSEVSIQQCVPLNLGKHRKSASPTVSSCSEEIRNVNKDSGEPQEKRQRRESHDLAKICNLLKKSSENKLAEQKKRLSEIEQLSPLKQLDLLKSNKNFNLPEHMLVPRDRLSRIITAPGKEIPALLMERPQLHVPDILQDPNFIGDPELMVISLEQIRQLIIHSVKSHTDKSNKTPDSETSKETTRESDKEPVSSAKSTSKSSEQHKPSSSERTPTPSRVTPQPSSEQPGPGPRSIPSMGHLADDIDAANSAAAYQMSWLPNYLSHLSQMSQLEAVAACTQNAEFLKALASSGAYAGTNYANLSQMFHPSRFINLPNLPMMPAMDYENRMQLALWQEAVNASAAQAQRAQAQHKHAAAEASHKDAAAHMDFPNPYAHFAKGQPAAQSPGGKSGAARSSPHAARSSPHAARTSPHAARTSPHAAGGFPGNQRAHLMYPGMRPGAPPDIQIPYYAPPAAGRDRDRASKSPVSPYYPNNNYLHAGKGQGGGQGSPRPRISVKSLQELQHAASSQARRAAAPAHAPGARRREEHEVGSTTSAGDPPLPPPPPPPHLPMPPHPHDPAAFPIWHPLFSNQKGYTSPWSWTTVTATGD